MYNRLGSLMPNGSSIVSYQTGSTTQGALIVPAIGDQNKFYIFSLENITGTSTANADHLAYSVVDMTLAGGLGDVISTSKGIVIDSMLGEAMVAIPGNSCNVWLVVHRLDSAVFRAYEITSAGIRTTAVRSSVGSLSGPYAYGQGVMKCSPDRSMLVAVKPRPDPGTWPVTKAVELYDFNPTTGGISNCRVLDTVNGAYGAEFSPDNTKLYVSPKTGSVTQYNLNLSNLTAIRASAHNIATGAGKDMKLAPDGKIYFQSAASFSTYLDCITNPNQSAAACAYVNNAVNVGQTIANGLPSLVWVVDSTSNISGPTSVCAGAAITLTDATPGGRWTSNNTSVATVGSSSGVVTGVSSGIDTIKYTPSPGCPAIYVVTINPAPPSFTITGPSTVCFGAPITLSGIVPGGVWSTNGHTSVSGSTVTAVSVGVDTIRYVITTSCGTSTGTHIVTVGISPSAGGITGASFLCAGGNVTLSATVPGGTWSSGAPAVAAVGSTGMVSGIVAGIATISYSITSACGISYATKLVTVNPVPPSFGLSGASSVCIGSMITIAEPVPGGTWSASNANATVAGGNVTGISTGTDSIYYTITTSCGTSAGMHQLTVNAVPAAAVVAGASAVCEFAVTALSASVSGGVWSSGNPAVATVDSSGLVAGVAVGAMVAYYELTNTCGSTTTSHAVTINPLPHAGVVSGPDSVCEGAIVGLSGTVTGGAWSSSNLSIATVGSGTGIVNGVGAGNAVFSYSYANTCGTDIVTHAITVNPLPNAGTLSGPSVVCESATITLLASVTGGVWSSGNPMIAGAGSPGTVSGIATGTATISYSYANSCGTAVVTQPVTVNPLPSAGIISGLSSVCEGANLALTSTVPGGTWTSGNAAIATAGSSTGLITGVSAGSAAISYSVTNSCGTAVSAYVVTVNPLPAAGSISGPAVVCVGANIALAASAPGGVWTSSNTALASVGSSSGIVAGLSAGAPAISYSVTNGCGTDVAVAPVTVNPLPAAGTLSGGGAVCEGANIPLSSTTPGGLWASSNPAIATAGSISGVVTGALPGAAVISYSVTNACGTDVAIFPVTVNPLPHASISAGAPNLCVGAIMSLSGSPTGGNWTSGTPAIVSVGSSSGIVSGAGAGIAVVSYVYTNSCGTAVDTRPLIVLPLPNTGMLSGTHLVCTGAAITIAGAAPGGVWSATAGHASVLGGIVSGSSTGVDTIRYAVTNACGTAVATHVVTVSALPDAGTISGAPLVCVGAATILTSLMPGGAWSSSDMTKADVNAGGAVTGMATGTAVISYSITNSCGTSVTTHNMTISQSPLPGLVTGAAGVCVGSSAIFAGIPAGGTWGAANSSASVSAGGAVTGIAAGTDTIYYSLTNTCGSATTSKVIVINPSPVAGVLSGAHILHLCIPSSISLMSSMTGGIWSSANGRVAVSGGVVTCISAGTDTVVYTVSNACGSASAKHTVIVNPIPDAGMITGPSVVCSGTTIALTNAAGGGVWSSSGTSVATVNAGGVVTGVAGGVVSIDYTVTDSSCVAMTSKVVTVQPLPDAGVITTDAANAFCIGKQVHFFSTVPGGAWTVANGHATLAGNTLTAASPGTDTICYTVSNACGAAVAQYTIDVAPPVPPIGGRLKICVGDTAILHDALFGGMWQGSGPAIQLWSTVQDSGVIVGKSAGIAVVTYHMDLGCETTATVTVNALPDAGTITAPPTICKGTDAVLGESVPGGVWSMSPEGVITLSDLGAVHGVAAGDVMITYTVPPNIYGCTARALFPMSVLDGPGFTVRSIVASPKCYGEEGTISLTVAGGSGNFGYYWSATSATSSAVSVPSGSYFVRVTDSSTHCIDSATFIVTQPDSLSAEFEVTRDICGKGNGSITTIAAGGTPSYSYQWSNGASTSIANGLPAGAYLLLLRDANGCAKDFNVFVFDSGCAEITIHDGISPNGDGLNDAWVIEGIENYPHNVVQVYNKWGDLLFEQKGYRNDWNGYGKNGELPDGTYYYLVKLNDLSSGKSVLTGALLIKR